MPIRKITLPDNTTVDINDARIRKYRGMTGTAAQTSSPYYCARWDVTDNTVTAYEDGMIVWLEVPIAGNGSYGTCLQINDLGYHPIVYNVNSMISTRYSVGAMVIAMYNATQTATAYFGSGAQTVTGCWQVQDYDSNSTSISNLYHPRGTRVVAGGQLKRYVMCVEANETEIIPLNYTGTTATTKTMTTASFDPTREILFYTTNANIAEGDPVALSGCFYSNTLVDLRYTFNCGTTLTANKEVYMVMDVQSDGRLCKLASTPWSQTLPNSNDGHVYMLLGFTQDTYRAELYPQHPMYYHDGTSLKVWHGVVSGSGGSTTLDGLTDTTITTPTDGQVLTYDDTTSKWVNADMPQEVFWVTFTDDGDTVTCDKTNAEIYAASQSGKTIIGKISNGSSILQPIIVSSGGTVFSSTVLLSNTLLYNYTLQGVNNTWAAYNLNLSNPVSDSSYVHTDNNYTTAEKAKLASLTAGHDFTHTANTTVSGSTTTITYAANTRGSQMITVSADLDITFAVNNLSDNYLWIANSGSAAVDITVSSVTLNSSAVSSVYVPSDGISVPAGGVCEIGVIANSDGAFITSRNDLTL